MAVGHTSLDTNIMVLGPMANGYLHNSGSDSGKSLFVDAYFIRPIQELCRREYSGLKDTLHPLTHTHTHTHTQHYPPFKNQR